MWAGRAKSQRRCGWGEPSPSEDVGGVSQVPAQIWPRHRCGRGEPSPGTDVDSPVTDGVWQAGAKCVYCRVSQASLDPLGITYIGTLISTICTLSVLIGTLSPIIGAVTR